MFSLKATVPKPLSTPIKAMEKRLRSPMAGASGRAAARIIKYGPGSISDQFNKETSIGPTVTKPWPKSKKFGTRRPPRKTLQRTGALKRAWLTGSLSKGSGRTVTVSPDTSSVPYLLTHQKGGRIFAKYLSADEVHSAMWWFLRLNFKVRINDSKAINTGYVIPKRSIYINKFVTDRIGLMLNNYFVTGKVGKF